MLKVSATKRAANRKQKPTPVEDVLLYCRKPGRTLATGRSLATVLPAQIAHDSYAQEVALADAMEQLLREELDRLRGTAVDLACTEHDTAAVCRFKADLALAQPKLTALSLIWAFYIERLDVAQLGGVLGLSTRRVYERIRQARLEVEQLVARRARARAEAENGTLSGVCDTPMAEPQAPQRSASSAGYTLLDQVVVLSDDSIGVSRPDRRATPKTRRRNGLERLCSAVAGLVMPPAGYLLFAVPLLMGAALLVLAAWRAATGGWRAVRGRPMANDA